MNKRLALILILFFQLPLVKSQTPGYSLSNIVIKPGTPNPVEKIKPISVDKLHTDSTLDIVNWNVNFLGAPQMVNNKYGNRDKHISGVAAKLVQTNADIYALQEVVVDSYNGNALKDLLTQMNQLAGKDLYDGKWSEYHSFYWNNDDPEFPSQCLAFIWNKNTVKVNKDSALLKNIAGQNDFGYGRLPYMLDVNVTLRGVTQRYFLVNLHLKAQKGFSEDRAESMELLRKLLNVNYFSNNVVILGDLNVVDGAGAIGEIKNWGVYEDNELDGLVDYVHVAGNKTNGIEHTLISNELFDELAYISDYDWNVVIDGTKDKLSDHSGYITSLYVHEKASGSEPSSNPIFDNTDGITMLKSDYQVIVDYVKNDQVLSKLDPSTFKDSEYYFGASAYYSNFDIRNEKHHSSFKSWEEAVQSGIMLALLPSTYPNAVADANKIYKVTFDTYSGVNGKASFQFICNQSAPNPKFGLYTGPALMVTKQFQNKRTIFPNPVNNILNIENGTKSLVKIYNSNGQLVQIFALSQNQINVSGLTIGLYWIEVEGVLYQFLKY